VAFVFAWFNTFFYVSVLAAGTNVFPVGRVGSLTLIGPITLTGPSIVFDVIVVVTVGAIAKEWLDASVVIPDPGTLTVLP